MNRQSIVWLFLALVAVYVTLYYNTSLEQETIDRYELSAAQVIWLRTTILVPLLLVWLTALYGFIKLLQYAQTITGSPESEPVNQMAKGLMILAFGFPIAGIASNIASMQIAENPAWEPTATILRNYFQIVFPLIAFIYINRGAEKLSATVRMKFPDLHAKLFMLGFILLASVYTTLMMTMPFSDEPVRSVYFLPPWLIVITIITPYLFTWYNGISAAYLLIRYRNKVRGVIYKSSFGRLALGFIVITTTAILIRFIVTLNEQLTQLNISPLLMIIYALVVLYGIGYGLVASGANRLTKLEKV